MARANGVREAWQQGRPVINSWLGIPSSFSAEAMASLGWDSLVVDMQHGMIDYQMMVTMLQGISTTNVTPLVRVPWNDPAHIQKALDAGAYGIICPMINNRAEAEKFVGSCRYAPLGYRSSGPIRASLYGGSDYHMKANDIVLAFGMIETQEALDNLDDILSVKGLDAIYVGPSDLSISLGYNPGGDKPDEWMMTALNKILDACKRHKVQPGIHCGAPSYAKKMIERGFTFVTVGGDNRFMTMGGTQALQEMRQGGAKPSASAGGSSPY
ncbi:MAG: 2,4-dihydroxyhept-2-ene-1,7-dioic acid aldolase [Alphaproteobacteria bacterium]|nr:2,4-dihydroxyhept-2-ene-1,7-dioic acid aldolase [Alphaproteobacteria bacterium]